MGGRRRRAVDGRVSVGARRPEALAGIELDRRTRHRDRAAPPAGRRQRSEQRIGARSGATTPDAREGASSNGTSARARIERLAARSAAQSERDRAKERRGARALEAQRGGGSAAGKRRAQRAARATPRTARLGAGRARPSAAARRASALRAELARHEAGVATQALSDRRRRDAAVDARRWRERDAIAEAHDEASAQREPGAAPSATAADARSAMPPWPSATRRCVERDRR